jgi:hypothetical protein
MSVLRQSRINSARLFGGDSGNGGKAGNEAGVLTGASREGGPAAPGAPLGPHATQIGELGGSQGTGTSMLSEPMVTRREPGAVQV